MSRPQRRLMVSGLCAMICLAIADQAFGAGNGFDGVYTGKRVLTKGSNETCHPTEDDVSVTIHGHAVTFTDSRLRNFTIGFYPHPDGSFSQISTGVEPNIVLIEGRIVGDDIEADVVGDDCVHHWHLKRTEPP